MTARMLYEPVSTARMFLYLREVAANHGLRIEGVQHWGCGQFGDSWCGLFAIGFILDICFQGNSPFPRTTDINASTVAALAYARAQGWVTDTPAVGDLVFSVLEDGTPHHVAICSSLEPFETIAGNTSEDGVSANGDRVAEHPVSRQGKVFVHYPRGA
jgi:hypothetical protein